MLIRQFCKIPFVSVSVLLSVSLQVLSGSPLPVLAQDPNTQLRVYYQQVVNSYESDLATARQTGQRSDEIRVLMTAGIAHRYFEQYQQAIKLHQQALEIARAIGDRGNEEMVIRELATNYSKLGDDQGVNFLQQQVKLLQQTGDRTSQGIVLKQLGFAYLMLSNFLGVIDTYEQYLPIVRSQNNPQEEALALSILAGAYGSAGDRPKQIDLLQQQLVLAQASKDKQQEGLVLSTLSTVYRYQGDAQRSLAFQQQAVEVARQSGNDQVQIIQLQQLALLQASLNQRSETIDSLEQALAIANKTNNVFLQGQSLDYLGRTYFLLGRYDKAIDYQQQSLTAYRQFNQSEKVPTLSEAQVLESLGLSLFRSGKLTEAEATLRETIQIYSALRQGAVGNVNLLSVSRDDLNLSLYEGVSSAYRLLQQVLVAKNQLNLALEASEEGRARAFAKLLIGRLAVDEKSQSSDPPLRLAQIQQIAKDHNSTLVEYSVLYDDLKFSQLQFGQLRSIPTALQIWVVQPSGKVTLRQVDLSPLLQRQISLDKLVPSARNAIGVLGRGLQVVPRQTGRGVNSQVPELQLLHQLLIQPIADLLPQDPNARVTFIPQDFLFLVPFPALQDSTGKYLIEQHTILTAPSIQVLDLTHQQRLRQPRSTPLIPPATALVVGNPTMPSLRLKPGAPSEQLPALPGAEREAKAIAALLQTPAITGSHATKATVLEKMSNARIIHLATHGLLDDFGGLQGSLAIAPSGNKVTSGQARPADSSPNDGFLQPREVAKLRLNAELVVLSACDTGRGRISGDGVVGISRTFIAAGVPSIVVSLWSIPDAPTVALMTTFYQNLQRSPDKAQALRQAMLSTLQQYPEPVNWAAFTLIGEAE